MEKEYKMFLNDKKYIESRIISELIKSSGFGVNNYKLFFRKYNHVLLDFIKHYEENMCSFEQEVANVDIERIMEDSYIDASFEKMDLKNNNIYDVSQEILDYNTVKKI